jgi:hypothetical protein
LAKDLQVPHLFQAFTTAVLVKPAPLRVTTSPPTKGGPMGHGGGGDEAIRRIGVEVNQLRGRHRQGPSQGYLLQSRAQPIASPALG